MFHTILLVLLVLLIAVVAFGVLTLRKALHRQTVALGQAYGNVTEQADGIIAAVGLVKHDLRAEIDKVRGEATEVAAATNKDLLEAVTAITTSFMQETIEIKAGVEAIVDVLSSAAAPAAAEAPSDKGPCAVKGCTKPAEVVTSWKMDILTPAEDVAVCEPHAEMMAKQAFQAPKGKAAPPERVVGQRAPDDKCEHGVDMGPDYVWGQIHAHIDDNNKVFDPSAKVPDRQKFAQEHGIGDGAPDTSVLTPEPLDPITAAIEASFRAGKQA